MTVELVAPGELIIDRLKIGQESLYIIKRGQVIINFDSVDRDFNIIKENSKPDCVIRNENETFGEISLFYNCQSQATVKGLTYATLGVLNKINFKTVCNDFPMFEQIIKENIFNYEYKFKTKNFKTMERMPLFQGIGKEAMHEALYSFEVKVVLPGDVIINMGEFCDDMFIIQQGKICVETRVNDEEFCLEILG